MIELLDRLEGLLGKGEEDAAKELALRRDTREVRDAETHRKWAALCDRMGLVDDAIQELNLALRDAPGDILVLNKLAELHRDNGQVEKAIRCLKQVVEHNPENGEAYCKLGEVLEEAGKLEEAEALYRGGIEKTRFPALEMRLRALRSLQGGPPSGDEAEDSPLVPTDTQLVRFTNLFAGREAVYARQWVSPTGESGYTPVHEPLTLSVAKNHVLGNHTIGVYQVRIDQTVTFVAFDIDLPKYALNEAMTNRRLWESSIKKTHQAACTLMDIGASLEIPVILEDSGFKGRHCWIFLDSPIPARIAKRFASVFLSRLGNETFGTQIEVFPKQVQVREGGLGNLIKLPLGIHRRTGKRSHFIDPDGKPVPDPFVFLEKAESVTRQQIYRIIEGAQVTSVSVSVGAPLEVAPERQGPAPQVAEEYDPERDTPLQYLLARCPVLRTIVEKVHQTHEMGNEERIVLTHTVGLLERGPDAVNHYLKHCVNTEPSHFLKSRLRGNPISCPKIRSRIPQITSAVACNCAFPENTTLYPTPVLHVSLMTPETSLVGGTIDTLTFQGVLSEYLKIRKQMAECRKLLEAYEKRMDTFFQQAGVDEFATSWGTFKRIVEGEGKVSFELKL